MKAFVDPDLCIGCTQCTGICPEVFQMDRHRWPSLCRASSRPSTVPTAVEAAQACPVSAITHLGVTPSACLPNTGGHFCFFCKNPPLVPILCYTIECEL